MSSRFRANSDTFFKKTHLNHVSMVFRNRYTLSAGNVGSLSVRASRRPSCWRCPAQENHWGSSKISDPSMFRRRGDPLLTGDDLLRSNCRLSPRSPSVSSAPPSPGLGGEPHWSTELSGSLNSGSCTRNQRALGGRIEMIMHEIIMYWRIRALSIYSLDFFKRCKTYNESQVES